ncbi:MAG: gamma-glutamylcyclotransferase [bacterium]|nr:gamma-glutamylcyclotransferase [bacterium]MDE0240381.1 gamma-glutamylcyclotransferase [bacterium]
MSGIWIFGYGSLIWRPAMAFRTSRVARLAGWTRRFWQGSHDHRGLPHAPGRVVTLVAAPQASCDGLAYLVDRDVVETVFRNLDHREKNGYERHAVRLTFRDGGVVDAIVYIAAVGNHAWLGPAGDEEMVRQICQAAGPSGPNIDYLKDLAAALRDLEIKDPHVFRLECMARAFMARQEGSDGHTIRQASSKL